MKIKANNANSPIWKDVYSHSMLPEQLQPLYEMATNLWWVWNHEGAKLFGKIDSELWASTEGNPVLLLQSLSYKRIEEILADDVLMAEIKAVYSIFKDYVNVKPDQTKPSVAYFSMEYGLTNVLKIYSGGLGVLAGDYLKEASDSNIDLTAVGFLYRYGYFTQSLSMDGQQIANYEPQNFNALPLTQVMQANGEPMVLEVPYPGRTVYAHIWKVSVGRVPLYLMDTDIPQNSEWDRSITHQLYGGDWENRMKQEYPDAEQIRNQETDLSLQRRTRRTDQRAASGRLHPERRSVIQPSIGSRTRFRPIHRPHTGSGWSRLLR